MLLSVLTNDTCKPPLLENNFFFTLNLATYICTYRSSWGWSTEV